MERFPKSQTETMRKILMLLPIFFACIQLLAQADSSVVLKPVKAFSKADSVYLAKLNSSGNLMIGGGIGLMGASGFLIYQGYKIYNDRGPTPNAATTERNKRQGTIYLAAGGVAALGGVVLVALGASNKVTFKRKQKLMSLQSGLLDSGGLGLAFGF
jgi:hypothetical protein